MKNRGKRLLVLGMSMMLTFSCVACGNEQSVQNDSVESTEQSSEAMVNASDAQDFGATVTELQVGANNVLVYYPTPNANDTLGVNTTCTSPVFMVFGEGAYDAESAVAYAQESGLATLAAENGSSVCFVNPAADTWTEADAAAYGAVAQVVADSSTDVRENGITKAVNPMTQEKTQSITGTQQRIYIYAIGAGADYIASTALKTVEAPTFWGGLVNVTPAGCTVSGLTDASKVEANDIPVVSIGNSDEVNAILEEKCGSVLVETEADYVAEYASVIGNYRRQVGVLVPFCDYEAEGIVQKVETCMVSTSADNAMVFAGTEEHPINYVTYYAKDLDVENGNVPLVLCFHGGGNTALYQAQASEWPLIGKENGFMTVSVDLHFPNCTATEIVALIDVLKETYSIDATRIYATGFSMGGCKSWDLFEQYPQVFAGVAPMDASFEPGVDSYDNPVAEVNTDVIVPIFYVGGEASPLPELPVQAETLVNRMASLFEVNDIVAEYNVSFVDAANWENAIWGIDGDMSYTVSDEKAFKDSVLTVQLFESEDGICYTALASSSNQMHEVYARNSWAAWDFLSQFSRNEDGSISVEQVTYKLPADDGSVVDNSYNMQ